MTTNASLPPADVQRPEPLTEEELAAIEFGPPIAYSVTRRLVADLRASRAEVKRLREALDFYANPENWEAKFVGMSGPATDGGERARRALNVPLP